MMERTLAIIKPDAVAQGYIGEIAGRIEKEGIRIVAMRMEHMDRKKAEGFYYVHKEKPFFRTLIDFMTEGPCVLMVLEGNEIIPQWRNLMGATNPAEADRGTIRADLGTNIERNATHGSDSRENAVYEVNYFFKGTEIF